MKTLVLFILSYAFGYIVGKEVVKRKVREAAGSFAGSTTKAINEAKDVLATIQQHPPVDKPRPVSDTLARGPLPIPNWDMEGALKNGEVAVFIPKDGNC